MKRYNLFARELLEKLSEWYGENTASSAFAIEHAEG